MEPQQKSTENKRKQRKGTIKFKSPFRRFWVVFISVLIVLIIAMFAEIIWVRHVKETGQQVAVEVIDIWGTGSGISVSAKRYILEFQFNMGADTFVRSRHYSGTAYNKLKYKEGAIVNVYYDSQLDPFIFFFVIDGEQDVRKSSAITLSVGLAVLLFIALRMAYMMRGKRKSKR